MSNLNMTQLTVIRIVLFFNNIQPCNMGQVPTAVIMQYVDIIEDTYSPRYSEMNTADSLRRLCVQTEANQPLIGVTVFIRVKNQHYGFYQAQRSS